MDKYSILTKQGRNNYLQWLTNIGWFSYRPNIKTEIKIRLSNESDSKYYVTTLYDLWFDTEGFEDDESYANLLEEILDIIDIDVHSKDVKYLADLDVIAISITTQKNTYKYKIDLEEFGDWFNEDFITGFINNTVLKNENIENRFFQLPNSDQTILFTYITTTIYENAIEKGIIPENINYFEED